jgi:hypothetical protein
VRRRVFLRVLELGCGTRTGARHALAPLANELTPISPPLSPPNPQPSSFAKQELGITSQEFALAEDKWELLQERVQEKYQAMQAENVPPSESEGGGGSAVGSVRSRGSRGSDL